MKPAVLVFTGGGETSVLNATIYGAVSEAKARGMRVLGGLCGWASLVEDRVVNLNDVDLEGIQNIGGTLLRTSRTNPFKIQGGVQALKKTMRKHGIDYLLPIGGDDTLGAAHRLFVEEGIPVVGCPKTADNDLNGTYFTPGFPSAAFALADLVNRVKRDNAIPRHRGFVIESHGGQAGWLPSAGIMGGADIVTIPEQEVKLSHFVERAKEIVEKQNCGVFVISKETKFDVPLGMDEDQGDTFGVKRTRHICVGLQDVLQKNLGVNCQAITPANFLRSGRGHEVDILLATDVGKHAVELIASGRLGEMSCVDHDGDALTVTSRPMRLAVGKNNYREMPKHYYDQTSLLPTTAYREYLWSIFGDHDWGDGWYYSLMNDLFLGEKDHFRVVKKGRFIKTRRLP